MSRTNTLRVFSCYSSKAFTAELTQLTLAQLSMLAVCCLDSDLVCFSSGLVRLVNKIKTFLKKERKKRNPLNLVSVCIWFKRVPRPTCREVFSVQQTCVYVCWVKEKKKTVKDDVWMCVSNGMCECVFL